MEIEYGIAIWSAIQNLFSFTSNMIKKKDIESVKEFYEL